MNAESLDNQVSRARQTCLERFGRPAQWTAVAPGRVNLIGGHIDYNDGIVMPIAIQRYAVVAGVPNDSKQASIFSESESAAIEFQLDEVPQPLPPGSWGNYPLGVVTEFMRRNYSLPGFDAVVCSSVPAGAGLSSSAALEVATATFLEAVLGTKLDPLEKACMCQAAEHDFAGVPCGLMDQVASVFAASGQIVRMDCQSNAIEGIALDEEISVVIISSHEPHRLVAGEYAIRRQQANRALKSLGKKSWRDVSPDDLSAKRQQLNDIHYRRARHIVTEIKRAKQFAVALAQKDWTGAGRLLYASHQSLRVDYEVSSGRLDLLVETGQSLDAKSGLYGMRMTGGGFGGCVVGLVRTDYTESVIQAIQHGFQLATGVRPEAFATRPAQGAHVIA
ncbi:MAG: galactokinase [Pirellulaceae bacterium]